MSTNKVCHDRTLYHLHAEVCKTLSHPKRLQILNILQDVEMSAGDIVAKMGIPKANVSQHLAVMRHAGILETRRNGLNVFYRISNRKVTKACELMREVLIEHHSRKDKILKEQS